jgi:DNA-binding transcriptional LysR family regulator
MNYSINDLRVFVAVAQNGNLSAAARRCQLTPAAVSAIVKRLEAALGARLLERSSRACRLTGAGEAFHLAAGSALEALADGEAAVRRGTRELKGLVRVAAPTDLARDALAPWLDEFQSRHPDIELAIHLSDTVHDLLSDTIDLALRYGELPDSGLVARRLCDTRRVTCASPSYLERRGVPQAPADLAGHNCLTFRVGGRNDATWHFTGPGGDTHKVRVTGDRRSDDSALVKLWAVQGRGIINKSDVDLADDLAAGRLVQVLADHAGPVVPLSLMFVGARQLPAPVRALADFLVERFEAPRAFPAPGQP